MTEKTLTVLLIEDSPEYAELVQRWLSSRKDITFILNWTDSLLDGVSRMSQGGVDVILLDLGLPDSEGMNTFTTARIHASGVPIILLSSVDSQGLALQMVQEGAQDYLIKSTCNADTLQKAIQYAIVRFNGTSGVDRHGRIPEQAKIIGVLGCKGGVGATTVACNLAVELRRQTDQKTLLADMEMNAGLVALLTSSESEFSILDAVKHLSHLDQSCWDGIVSHGVSDLHVVRSPSLLGDGEVEADKLRHVLTLVRTYYQWIVLDLGRLNRFSATLLDRVNEIHLITTPNIPSLYEAKRTIDSLRKAGFEGDRLRLVMNQNDKTQPYSENDLQRVFNTAIYAVLPSAGQELHEACVQGRYLAESSPFRIQIASLARKAAGLPAEKAKWTSSHLFSFAEKFRKVEPTMRGN